ncbi:hypothetical protein BGY98DRAFT_1020529 [Russula aff. rugulosa BPL654]|nr:hypothetical protein BGY98DRAFT_1020529 [Russula aff. rugulosa BPL654]
MQHVSRGLDFPSIDWVVQADALEDAATYLGAWKRSDHVYDAHLIITRLV